MRIESYVVNASGVSMRVSRRLSAVVCAVSIASVGPTALSGGPPAAVATPLTAAVAASPRASTPYVAVLGDSYTSGEAGRWAGSSDISTSYADALGPTAYFDDASHTAERISGCHRSRSDEAYVGRGVGGVDLACSGAMTRTYTDDHGHFKPGLDFYHDASGHIGQARALRRFASSHRVAMVVVSIGGNDFGFGAVVTQCVTDFLTSPIWAKDFCSDDASVVAAFDSTHQAAVRAKVTRGLLRVRQAMRDAGYNNRSWTLVVQTYPSPIPHGRGFRYSEGDFTRQAVGGCGFWNADARWANATALPSINGTVQTALQAARIRGAKVLDVSHAFNGRRLCESSVGLYEERGLTSWTQPGAVDATEWVNQIRTLSAAAGPYSVQESLHPNYWGQLALRSCVRKVYHGGAPRGGTCVIAGHGLLHGEPRMHLR